MRRANKTLRALTRFGLPAALALGTLAYAANADAKPNIRRKGGQWGIMLGGSACIPGKAKCKREEITVDGKTRPSFGMGIDLGYRINRFVFVGAQYNLGFFDADYEIPNTAYKRAFQNSVFGVVRPTLPVWRFDFGLGLGAGFSRQTFKYENGDRDYTQGFVWKFEPTIDIWVHRRVFIGAKADLLLNAHTRTCRERGANTNCTDTQDTDLAPVHQILFGLHVGGTFF